MKKLETYPSAPKGRGGRLCLSNDSLWSVIRDLRDCQPAYGLKARHLATLEALVSFLKGQDHQMVFASNRAILERLNYVSPRTLQRALSDLVSAGLVVRRDSPNRKRFAIRHYGGREALAYGLDLSPLLEQSSQIASTAEEYRAESIRCKQLKLRLRQLAGRLEEARPFDPWVMEVHRVLRRKLSSDQLEVILASSESLLSEIPNYSGRVINLRVIDEAASEMTPTGSHSDAHHHKSEKEEKDNKAAERDMCHDEVPRGLVLDEQVLLTRVKCACPETTTYSDRPIRSWSELRNSADTIAAWLGVPMHLIAQLRHRFGPDRAAVAIFCLLQSASSIRKPGAYLASLVSGAHAAEFDPMRWLGRLAAAASCSRQPRTEPLI